MTSTDYASLSRAELAAVVAERMGSKLIEIRSRGGTFDPEGDGNDFFRVWDWAADNVEGWNTLAVLALTGRHPNPFRRAFLIALCRATEAR